MASESRLRLETGSWAWFCLQSNQAGAHLHTTKCVISKQVFTNCAAVSGDIPMVLGEAGGFVDQLSL